MKIFKRIFVAIGSTAICGSAIAQSPSPAPDTQRGNQPQQQQNQAQDQQQQPQAPRQNASDAFHESGSSLLRASLATRNDAGQAPLASVSYFAVPEPEPRVLRKHDLVTIIVREESRFKSDASTEFKKQASLDASISEFIQVNQLLRELQLRGGGVGDDPPAVSLQGSRDFKGEGSVDRSDTLTFRITAEIVDVKPNGTVVLQARQRIVNDEEEQEFVLSGICRAADVTADNSVLSTQMFDKELRKYHKGTVRNASRRGWLSKLLDAVSPF